MTLLLDGNDLTPRSLMVSKTRARILTHCRHPNALPQHENTQQYRITPPRRIISHRTAPHHTTIHLSINAAALSHRDFLAFTTPHITPQFWFRVVFTV